MKQNEIFDANLYSHYVRDFIIPESLIQELLSFAQKNDSNFSPAKIYISEDRRGLLDATRTCMHFHYKLSHGAPDVSPHLKELAQELFIEWPENLRFGQYEIIKYQNIGDQFLRHRDDDAYGSGHNRHLTSVTLLDKSTDLIGCDLKLWSFYEDQKSIATINLEIGETVIFPAYYPHEATTLLCGSRTVLISWAEKIS